MPWKEGNQTSRVVIPVYNSTSIQVVNMNPNQTADELRKIAAKIDNSKQPSRSAVENDIRRIISTIDRENDLVNMEGGQLIDWTTPDGTYNSLEFFPDQKYVVTTCCGVKLVWPVDMDNPLVHNKHLFRRPDRALNPTDAAFVDSLCREAYGYGLLQGKQISEPAL
jgi:hypothetical protein